jgi:hypothetical protein
LDFLPFDWYAGRGQVSIPYQSLINLYLKDCAATGKRLNLAWKASAAKSAA